MKPRSFNALHVACAIGVWLLSACGGPMAALSSQRDRCTADRDCDVGQLCYAEGCGDPTKAVVVEIAGNAQAGLYSRDIELPEGSLGKTRDFELGGPLVLGGEFHQERPANPAPPYTPYLDAVILRAVGSSELIPGIARVYEQRFDRLEEGRFQMSIGAGLFQLTVLPSDLSIPPAILNGVRFGLQLPAVRATFVLPAAESTPTLRGLLVKDVDETLTPVRVLPLTEFAMDLQAFNPEKGEPLSQRIPVSSGRPDSLGDFSLSLSRNALGLKTIVLVASPREGGALAPSKTFPISAPFEGPVTLRLGPFGEPARVQGQVLGADGLPIARAQVLIDGVVAGGSTFRSRVATTEPNGTFTLTALGSADAQSLFLSVLPPADSPAAATRVPIRVLLTPQGAQLTPRSITCGKRLTVRGLVFDPNGAPVSKVVVRAIEHVSSPGPLNGRPLNLEDAETATDDTGAFELRLDPATWRFEYVSAQWPLASRLVKLSIDRDLSGDPILEVPLPPVSFSMGRSISGTVTGTLAARPNSPVAYATLRFFRVAQIEGRPSAILLGTSVADGQGRYSVILPER